MVKINHHHHHHHHHTTIIILYHHHHHTTGPSLSLLMQGAIIRVLTYRRYANITVWHFYVFSDVPRRYVELLRRTLSAYLVFDGTTWPFQAQGIQYRNLVGISCVWDVLAWNMIALMALRNVGVDCLYMQLCFFFYLVVCTYFSETCALMTKYTLMTRVRNSRRLPAIAGSFRTLPAIFNFKA
jgi:uncharacterized membrane protein (GlpM family)